MDIPEPCERLRLALLKVLTQLRLMAGTTISHDKAPRYRQAEHHPKGDRLLIELQELIRSSRESIVGVAREIDPLQSGPPGRWTSELNQTLANLDALSIRGGWRVSAIYPEEFSRAEKAIHACQCYLATADYSARPAQFSTDREFMKRALNLARSCVTEAGRSDPSPKVGAVLVSNGVVIGEAFRGEGDGRGDHAEYILLEKKLKNDTRVAGSTLYTTLEPCTHRSPNKTPCADRIIERRIKKVCIGVLDPDHRVLGKGHTKLQEARIEVGVFDSDIALEIMDLDRDFRRHRKQQTSQSPTPTHSPSDQNSLVGQIKTLSGVRDHIAKLRMDLPKRKAQLSADAYSHHLETMFVAAGSALQRARPIGVFDEYVDLLNILDAVDQRQYAWQSGNLARDRFHGFWYWINGRDDPGFDHRGEYQPYALMRLEEIVDRAINERMETF